MLQHIKRLQNPQKYHFAKPSLEWETRAVNVTCERAATKQQLYVCLLDNNIEVVRNNNSTGI